MIYTLSLHDALPICNLRRTLNSTYHRSNYLVDFGNDNGISWNWTFNFLVVSINYGINRFSFSFFNSSGKKSTSKKQPKTDARAGKREQRPHGIYSCYHVNRPN